MKGYGDTALPINNGAEKRSEVALKPVVTVSPLTGDDSISSAEAAALQVSGSSKGFKVNDTIKVTVTSGLNTSNTYVEDITLDGSGSWTTAVMDIRGWEGGDVNVEVTGSNDAGQDIGLVTHKAVYLDTIPPAVSAFNITSSNPVQDGEVVTVSIEFSERVKDVTANVGSVGVTFDAGDALRKVWTGRTATAVGLEANKTELTATVGSYSDTSDTQPSSPYSQSFRVQPVVTINNVATNDIIQHGDEDISAVVISGTTKGMESGAKLSLAVVSKKNGRDVEDSFNTDEIEVLGDGTWSQTVSFQSWEEAGMSITVSGKNNQNVSASQTKENVLYEDAVTPELLSSGFVMSGSATDALVHGEAATVTLTFSERVSAPEVLLNNQVVTLTGSGPKKEWSGSTPALILPSGASTAELVVKGYGDTALPINNGAEKRSEVALKPVVTVSPLTGDDSISSAEAAALQVSGSSKGFKVNDTIKVTVTSGLNTSNTYVEDITLDGSGSWTTAVMDIRGWEGGDVNVEVTGSNDAGQDIGLVTHKATYDK
ncbi:hypothetical protein G3U99_18945 [Vibrio coralliilyticus OCN008]|uniref:hypothetical protein n=1 Tax=Vibrio coralliilyticus TaxID=190893 RepID=UPI0013F3ABC3|nr:hypothetical protein [Vibrio coralliilyticus]QIJ86346.1 hypothetical protein G3U99_18945 [Vibrio coralliilyticus OCN008]